jgi:general stress protein 26
MSQVEISYEELEQEFLMELANLGSEDLGSERGVLATSKNDHVTARRMRLLSDGLTLYGWTLRSTRKAGQIMANPKVSVVVEYIQIDGVASVKGHPTDEPKFLELIRKKLPHRYDNMVKRWKTKSDRVVIKIIPKRIALTKYADAEARIDGGLYVLNVEERKAYRFGLS